MTDTAHSSASITARELSSWQPTHGSADNDLLPELSTIVSRSRDLARNHGVAAGAIQTLNDNIVGVGFRLSAKLDYKLLISLGYAESLKKNTPPTNTETEEDDDKSDENGDRQPVQPDGNTYDVQK